MSLSAARCRNDHRRGAIARRLLPAIAAAALACAWPHAAAKEKKHETHEGGPPFELVLETEQDQFTSEDAITMSATVYNNTDLDVIIDIGRLGAQGKYDILTTSSEDAVESGMWEPDRDLKPHKVTLKARHSLSRFVNLTKELAALFRDEGRIRVTLDFCDTAFGGDAAKPRCVSSNAIILRKAPEEAGVHHISR